MFCRRASRARPTGLYARAIHGAGRGLIWPRMAITLLTWQAFAEGKSIEDKLRKWHRIEAGAITKSILRNRITNIKNRTKEEE